MAERPSRYRRYTSEDRASAVGVALAEGVTEAERRTGIPRETVAYWLDRPEYAAIRERTRDQLAADVRAVFSLALDRLARLVTEGDVDLRSLAYTVDRLGTRLALLEGGATARVETWTDERRDPEWEARDAEAMRAAQEAYVDAFMRASGSPPDERDPGASGSRFSPCTGAGVVSSSLD